jgi:hypothetical protein
MMGISTLAHGPFYLVTACIDIACNQLLHSSVLVHIILAGVAAIRLFLGDIGRKRGGICYNELMAPVSGWWLESCNGRVSLLA